MTTRTGKARDAEVTAPPASGLGTIGICTLGAYRPGRAVRATPALLSKSSTDVEFHKGSGHALCAHEIPLSAKAGSLLSQNLWET
jgi:hypothetical protein